MLNAQFPNSDETRAFLIKVLDDLKLEKLENAEKAIYNSQGRNVGNKNKKDS